MIFDFEHWLNLFKKDPEAFMMQYKKVMDTYMKRRLSPQKLFKARAAQSRLMTKLNAVKDPTARFNIMVAIFWEGFHEFKKSHNEFRNLNMELKK